METDHLRHETAQMQGGRAETLATRSTDQAQGQQVSGSPSSDTNSLWVLTEGGGCYRVPWGSPSLAKLLGDRGSKAEGLKCYDAQS